MHVDTTLPGSQFLVLLTSGLHHPVCLYCLYNTRTAYVLPQPRKASASNIIMAKPQPQPQQDANNGDNGTKPPHPPPPLGGMAALRAALASIPFRSMLSNRVVQGMCISHFIYGE